MTIPFAYKGEAMLVRWSETPKGRTVTLLLDPLVGDQHPFKFLKCGENGQRMQIAAALIGDDEKPAVPPTRPKVAEKKTVEAEVQKERTYTRSQRAAIMCQDREFSAWLRRLCERHRPGYSFDMDTDAVLKVYLGVASKKELDTDPEAAARFDALRTDYELKDMVR